MSKKSASSSPQYSALELAKNFQKKYGFHPDSVIAAFQISGREKATVEEAESMIKKFNRQQV